MNLHDFIANVENAVAELKDHLLGDAHDLGTEAASDATQVLHDTEAAAAPIVSEVKADAEQLASEAAADVADLTQTAVTPAATDESPAPTTAGGVVEQTPADSTSTPTA